MQNTAQTIDDFIAAYPTAVQARMQQLRRAIHEAAPGAGEKISYGIPTITLQGNLVHFSAYEHHLGFYPGAAPIVTFTEELKPYETAKGTIRFPLDQPLPLDLIRRIVKFRVAENLAKQKRQPPTP